MPRVIVEWLEGRDKQKRDQLAKEITEAFVQNINVRPNQVTIVFKENSPDFQYKAGENYKKIKED